MRWLAASVCASLLVLPPGARAQAPPGPAGDTVLASRPLELALAVVPYIAPQDFDLVDYRAAQRADTRVAPDEIAPHSNFRIRHHVGFAAGYDNGVLHGSIGLYVTVAEFGRWNYGVPSPALGFGRYRTYDASRKQLLTRDESTLFISLASVHYRVGYLESLGVNWYINLEQIFDLRKNTAGSQVGISFSSR